MPGYTIKTLEDVPDVLGDYPGEMRMLTTGFGTEQVAFTLPPDSAALRRQGLLRPLPQKPGGALLRRLRDSAVQAR